MNEWHMCECGMERLPPGVRACSACEVADRWADRFAAMKHERDAALTRAEQAEREVERLNGYVEDYRARLSNHQPAPEPNDRPAVWDLVIADMRERDHVGRERYGTPLQPHNGRDALVDAYQEALDLAVYLRQAIAERDGR